MKPEFAAGIDASSYVDERCRKTVAETSVLPGTNGLERRMKEMMNLNLWWFMQTLLDRKDRMSMYTLLKSARKALCMLVRESAGYGVLVMAGLPIAYDGKLFNAAAVFCGG